MKWIIYDEWKMKIILWLNKDVSEITREPVAYFWPGFKYTHNAFQESVDFFFFYSFQSSYIICGKMDISSIVFPYIHLSNPPPCHTVKIHKLALAG